MKSLHAPALCCSAWFGVLTARAWSRLRARIAGRWVRLATGHGPRANGRQPEQQEGEADADLALQQEDEPEECERRPEQQAEKPRIFVSRHPLPSAKPLAAERHADPVPAGEHPLQEPVIGNSGSAFCSPLLWYIPGMREWTMTHDTTKDTKSTKEFRGPIV